MFYTPVDHSTRFLWPCCTSARIHWLPVGRGSLSECQAEWIQSLKGWGEGGMGIGCRGDIRDDWHRTRSMTSVDVMAGSFQSFENLVLRSSLALLPESMGVVVL